MTVTRRVCRLRLEGPDETALRRARTALEDAMRTASLHDEGGRILLVRSLALGRLRSGARPAQVAGTLEDALRVAAADCRHGAEPTAGRARMVWFADALEAHLALARRLLVGPPPRAWYWPLVARAWRPDAAPQAGLAALARSLGALPEAPAALPAWVAALTREGHGAALREALREALEDEDARALTEALEASDRPQPNALPPDLAGSPATGAPRLARPGGNAGAAVPPAAGRGATTDAFLAAALRAAGEEALPEDTGYGAAGSGGRRGPFRARPAEPRPAPATSRRGRPTRPGSLRGVGGAGPTPAPQADDDGAARLEPLPWASEATLPGPRVTPVDGAPRRHASAATVGAGPPERHPDAPAWPALCDTAAGGVAFVLNVLLRLGYPAWLGYHPRYAERDLARRVLARILDGLDLPHEDAAWTLTRSLPRDPPEAREGVVVRAWSLAVHGWLRRHAAVRMAELVLRPARLSATRTHVDLWFDPELCDVRIRRVGLDLDPGWLPWLGRVVAFHYQPRGPR